MANDITKRTEKYFGEVFAQKLKDFLGAEKVEYRGQPPGQASGEQNDPPGDALYKVWLKDKEPIHTWMELTAVYPSDRTAEHARKAAEHQKSGDYEAAKKEHRQTIKAEKEEFSEWEHGQKIQKNFDRKMAEKVIDSMQKKINKGSYGSLVEKYGKGHLVLTIPLDTYSFTDEETIHHIKDRLFLGDLDRQTNFGWIWFAYYVSDGCYVSDQLAFHPLWSDDWLKHWVLAVVADKDTDAKELYGCLNGVEINLPNNKAAWFPGVFLSCYLPGYQVKILKEGPLLAEEPPADDNPVVEPSG